MTTAVNHGRNVLFKIQLQNSELKKRSHKVVNMNSEIQFKYKIK